MLKVFLSSTLRRFSPGYDPSKGAELSVEEKISVSELCKIMSIPGDRVKIIMVNGRSATLDHELKGDERVALFPPVGGG
ncbi:MAG: MoaD/ThiS family protein [Deltaproteobacteria bacterium]|nr:MoaD/ThiS family protein [Deltaproteobacteria bacterium]MBW2049709.1 MoaD/ThiS family protein [Deltaproteobacteria bacterium]MBW2112093.1 MoaD/ThiS family protein [Deltaproteobacteria bacterium]MBW2354400.1 MoaD/ThiS family protein [Deltaproteobacteria bacterium]